MRRGHRCTAPFPPRLRGGLRRPRLPLVLRLALRELRGGLKGFGIFLACIALGVAAIAGVSSLSRSLTEGIGREGRRILGGDMAFSLLQREANAAERAFLASQGRGELHRVHARHGAGGREGLGPGRAEGRGCGPIRRSGPRNRSAAAARADLLAERDGAFGAAADPGAAGAPRPQGRRPGHGGRRDDRAAREPRVRARQDRQRHRLRAAPARLAGGRAGDGADPARQPRALDLPGRSCRPTLDRAELGAIEAEADPRPAGSGLEHPHPPQRRSALCPQHRALHAVPDARRPDRASRRRRRRRQRGARLRRPQARLHRHLEEPRRAGRAGGHALPRPR